MVTAIPSSLPLPISKMAAPGSPDLYPSPKWPPAPPTPSRPGVRSSLPPPLLPQLHPGRWQRGRWPRFPAIVRSGGWDGLPSSGRWPAAPRRSSPSPQPLLLETRGGPWPATPRAWEGADEERLSPGGEAGLRARSAPQRSAARAALTPVLSAMPCGEDWLSHPLGIVQGFFGEWRVASRAGRGAEFAGPGLSRGRTRDHGPGESLRRARVAPGLAAEQRSRAAAQVPPPPVTCPPPDSGSLAAGTQLRALAVIDGLAPGWWPP